METRRWTNPSQPQTLYMATFLLYITAAMWALFGAIFSPLGLVLVLGAVAGGFGIANEKRWGYLLSLAIASLRLFFVVLPLVGKLSLIFDPFFLVNALFPVALFALLVHPMSREYQKIWFH